MLRSDLSVKALVVVVAASHVRLNETRYIYPFEPESMQTGTGLMFEHC